MPFEIPSSWEWTTLGHIGIWQSGGTPSRSNKSYYGGNIPWLKTGDLNDGLITDIPESITEEAVMNSSAKLNPAGSVLIAMYGATIGKLGILTFPATTNQACCACIQYDAVIQDYLFYFLLSQRNEFIAKGGGGAQPNISKEIIVSTEIPIPPLAEQERIVHEIKHWISLIDLIDQGKIDLQTTIKQAKNKILDLAIHGKLVPQDPNDEPASELLKRINPKAEITCDNGQYGKVPEGWCLCHIKDVAESLLGKTLDKSKDTGELKNYLCSINIQWDNFDLSTVKQCRIEKNDLERYTIRKGDLLVCEGGDVGRAAIWPFDKEMYYQNALHRIRFRDKISSRYFLYSFMCHKQSGVLDDISKGVTIKHLTQSTMNKIYFPLPPLAEQQRIVNAIDKAFAKLDTIMESL